MFSYIQERNKHPEDWHAILKEAGYVSTGLNFHWLIGKAPDLIVLIHIVPTEHRYLGANGSEIVIEMDPWIPEWMLAIHASVNSYDVEIEQCRRVLYNPQLQARLVRAARNGHEYMRKHDYEAKLRVKEVLGLPIPHPWPKFDSDGIEISEENQ